VRRTDVAAGLADGRQVRPPFVPGNKAQDTAPLVVMWRSPRWSPRQRSRMERQTGRQQPCSALRSSAGCSLSRMQAIASPTTSSAFSSVATARFLLKDGMSGMVSVASEAAATSPSRPVIRAWRAIAAGTGIVEQSHVIGQASAIVYVACV
jgi:hypothetical protein